MPIDNAVADQPTTTDDNAIATEELLSPESSSAEETAGAGAEGEAATQDAAIEEATYSLPDEQSKVFPENVLQEYADNRYPELAKLLADQSLPEPTRKQVRQILHDKLNGDIYIAKLQEQEETDEEETEEDVDAKEAPEPTQALTTEQRQAQQAQVETTLNAIVDEITDPAIAEGFVKRLADADAIKDPKQRAVAVTKALTYGMANALRDLLPRYLEDGGWLEKRIGGYINQNFEGFGESYKATTYQTTWEGIRQSNPRFQALPAYGTPEWTAAAQEAAAIIPGFENAIYTDPRTGKPLSQMQNFQKKAEAMANVLARTRGKIVEETLKAVETGKKQQRDAQNRKANAQLGAGKTRGQIASPAGDDPLKAALAATKADQDPFAVLRGNA
jgi:hypothetical protein